MNAETVLAPRGGRDGGDIEDRLYAVCGPVGAK